MANPNLIPILSILSFALIGGYGGMFLSIRDGYFDALKDCFNQSAEKKCILDVPHASDMPHFTHIPAIDNMIAFLVEFFAQGLRNRTSGDYDVPMLLGAVAWTAQFGSLWTLICLEGLRHANKKNALSYSGAWGMAFQTFTVTIFAPIFFVTHLLQSSYTPSQSELAVDLPDLEALPVSISLTYLLPTALVILGAAGIGSPKALYFAIAFWQFFPLYQSGIHPRLRSASPFKDSQKKQTRTAYKTALARVYWFVLLLGSGAHLLAVVGILVSQPSPLASLKDLLIPSSLLDPPTVALSIPPVSAVASKRIVDDFLKWDIYCSSSASIIWASILLGRVLDETNTLFTLVKVVLMALVGGPVAPAALLLCQRDLEVLRLEEATKEKEEKKVIHVKA